MKKKLLTMALCLGLAPLLSQCASQEEVQTLHYQLRVMNQKIENIKTESQRLTQKNQAASNSQLEQLDQEIMMLKNQLKATNEINNRLKQQNKDFEKNFSALTRQEAKKREKAIGQLRQDQEVKEKQLDFLKKKIAEQQDNVHAIQQARLRDAKRKAANAKNKADIRREQRKNIAQTGKSGYIKAETKKVMKPVKDSSFALREPSKRQQKVTSQQKTVAPDKVIAPTGAILIAKANTIFKENRLADAYTMFEEISQSNYDSKITAEALYMMGECRFYQKDYEDAVVRYQDLIRQYPDTPLSASSLLRQGNSFAKSLDKETSKMIYKKVIEKYPDSSQAIAATKELNK
ncbi:tetratricopeptide repeat protein [Desulfotalea psychrophila]|uniref:Uncharacterized protein n=1 Tax=Desulfotalea psychrophila (strain LSv54 / DSM 12343) TaxID=177439 RepID=Q6AKI3_DESPS|nr:tetratricopeptide repeat protein [Desulfotalea psychrophila]CAG37142.1 hypothetical protein DP2413 [Desulfotalea psychrophila LSv54]